MNGQLTTYCRRDVDSMKWKLGTENMNSNFMGFVDAVMKM